VWIYLFEIILDPTNLTFFVLVIAIIVGAIIVISRPFSSYVKFVYPNAKYETIGNSYIKEKELNALVESTNLNSFKETLNSSKDFNLEGDTTKEIQESLEKNLDKTIQMMRNDSSKKMNIFFDCYLEKNDFYIIKKELKNKLVNNYVNEDNIKKIRFKHNKRLLSEIKDASKEDMSEILLLYGFSDKIKNTISQDEIDFLKLDYIIDKYYIEKFKNVKVPYKCELGKKRFIQLFIDSNNVKNILRAKQMDYKKEQCMSLFLGEGLEIAKWKFEEIADSDSVSQAISSLEGTSYYNILKDSIEKYNKEQSAQVLEDAIDKLYLKHIKEISQENYITIGPTIRFIVSKEFEIRNLKAIAKGISENISSDLIKEILITEVQN